MHASGVTPAVEDAAQNDAGGRGPCEPKQTGFLNSHIDENYANIPFDHHHCYHFIPPTLASTNIWSESPTPFSCNDQPHRNPNHTK